MTEKDGVQGVGLGEEVGGLEILEITDKKILKSQ